MSIYLGYARNRKKYEDSKEYALIVYCGLNYQGRKDIGLGNVDKDKSIAEWKVSFLDYLRKQYRENDDIKTLLNHAVSLYNEQKKILLLCYCYKDVVEYTSELKDKCHTQIIADAIIKLAIAQKIEKDYNILVLKNKEKPKSTVGVRKYAAKNITELNENQVFVFGSNKTGFHGAGSAGYAMFGSGENHYRLGTCIPNTTFTLKTAKTGTKGLWAVLGVAEGFQIGQTGKSYAIPTIVRPGQLKSMPLVKIKHSLINLWHFAKKHLELEFLMTPVGAGYSGYSPKEMENLLEDVIKEEGLPENMWLPTYDQVNKRNT